MNLSGNKILITGGASGIGLGLTERFVQEGNTVIICARRSDVMQQVTDRLPGVITKVCDVSVESEKTELYSWIKQEHPDLNVLVNNAGIQNWMNVTDPDFYQKMKTEIITNIEGPLHLASLFINLPSLTSIMNVTSGLAFVPFSKVPVYSATKAFLRSFTLSLRHQLRSKNIEVIEIIPPVLNTDLGGKGLHDHAPSVSGYIDAVFEQMKEGKTSLTFGFSNDMLNADASALDAAYQRLNP